MLLCDSCDKGYHIYRLSRILLEVPGGDWFCQSCSDAAAVATELPFRVGPELRCKDNAGEWCSASPTQIPLLNVRPLLSRTGGPHYRVRGPYYRVRLRPIIAYTPYYPVRGENHTLVYI